MHDKTRVLKSHATVPLIKLLGQCGVYIYFLVVIKQPQKLFIGSYLILFYGSNILLQYKIWASHLLLTNLKGKYHEM